LLVVPVLLGAAALRIVTCGYSLWFDEIAAIRFAHQPLELLWSGWMGRESNPPLYYTLLKGWMALFGESDFAVQLLSVAIGTAGIGAAWWLARRIAGGTAGLIAALLLATSAAHVDFSQEVRGYILAQTAALFACVAMVAYLERPRLPPLFGYAVTALVALYAHTTMILFIALANLAMLSLLRRDRRALATWLAANAVVALLWSWWGWISLAQAGAPDPTFGWIERPDLVEALRMTSVIYLPFYLAAEKVVFAPLLALAWLGGIAWFAARDRRPAVLLLAAFAIGAPLLLWGLSQFVPIFLPRTLFWASGPMTVLLAAALVRLPQPRLRLVLGLALALEAGALLRWLPARESEAWPQAVAAIERMDPHAVVMVQGDAMGVATWHYLKSSGLRLVILPRPAGGEDGWAEGLVAAPHIDAAAARAMLAQEGAVFTFARGNYDPAKLLAGVGVERPIPAATRGRHPHLSLWRARQPDAAIR
jgi:4-amino-4-deoxy-L-arabinose transferase-like glycosyltransferase